MANRTNNASNAVIGEMLKKARERRHISQAEMSEKIGISKNHLSAIERGVNKSSVDLLLGYCKVLRCTPNDILGYSDDLLLPELEGELRTLDTDEQRKLAEMARIIKK